MRFGSILAAVLLLPCLCATDSNAANDLDTIALSLATKAYNMNITIDYENSRLANQCEMTIKNRGDFPIGEVPLQLFRLLSVDSVKSKTGRKLNVDQSVETYRDWDNMQTNFAVVGLPVELHPGDETTIVVYYGGYLTGYTETGMLYVKDKIDRDFTILRPDARAFPAIGVPSYKVNRRAGLPDFSYRISVTVPKPLSVVNGGKLVSQIDDDSLTTYVYENILPAWRIDIAIGRYQVLERDGLKVFCFVEDSLGGGRILAEADEAFQLYTKWFGPLRDFEGFTIIEIPDNWGSQADVTSIIQAAAAFRESSRTFELYHEISHLWNVKETDAFPPRWNEGLASFLEDLVSESLDSVEVLNKNANSIVARMSEYFEKHPEACAVSMDSYGRENLTGLSYSVGMLFYYLLYDMIGHQKFIDLQREFYQSYSKDGASSEFYMEFLTERVGEKGNMLIGDWLTGNRYVGLIRGSSDFEALAANYR